MPRYEYKLVPAPEKSTKIKGLKGAPRFAATLEGVMNELGAEGWQYLRADILPEVERSGLTSKQTTYRNLLVFMRELPPKEAPAPEPPPAPDAVMDAETLEPEPDEGALADLFTETDPPETLPPRDTDKT